MKKYNLNNYLRYKDDLKETIEQHEEIVLEELTRDQLIVRFLPLVENIARKFATSEQASGVLSINDLIQEGSVGLCKAIDRLDMSQISQSNDPLRTIKSFLSKRVKGAIRRAININRGPMRIPENKLNKLKKNNEDKKLLQLFYNSMFLSIDERYEDDEENAMYQIADESDDYVIYEINQFLKKICETHLSAREQVVLDMSYGLWGDKYSATYIADRIGITGTSAYVRVSEIKKRAIKKLTEATETSQILNFL